LWRKIAIALTGPESGYSPDTHSALFRSSFHRRFAERNTLRDDGNDPDVPRNGIMIMKLQDDTHDEKQTSEHDPLLADLL